jgi:hypothetical protein
MTDPKRLGSGSSLGAQLLRSVADEQPSDDSMQRTLVALGVSGVVLTTTTAAGAAASGAKVTTAVGASVGKSVTAVLLMKWVGVGVVGGVGLASAATVMTAPGKAPTSIASAPAPRRAVAPVVNQAPAPLVAPTRDSPEPTAPSPRASVRAPEPAPEPSADVGALLAAEVAYIDRARRLLASDQPEAGLAQLSRYEREFPEARLLPEVLFLQLDACERLGHTADARRAAERLATRFPKSPHAARARAALGARFP